MVKCDMSKVTPQTSFIYYAPPYNFQKYFLFIQQQVYKQSAETDKKKMKYSLKTFVLF